MKRIILASLLLASAVFAKTETMELTGVYSEQMGNPFKKVLNINKTKNINIYSENKDVVLKVESNLTRDITHMIPHPEKIIVKNKSAENILEDFYIEDFNVVHSSNNAVTLNIISGDVSLNYSFADERVGAHHLMGIEVNLLVSINGIEKKITMDETLGKKGQDYDLIISKSITIDTANLKEKVHEIIETSLYILIKGEKDKRWKV